jgi:hypothetical protein
MKFSVRVIPLGAAPLVISAAAFLMAADIRSVRPVGLTVHEWGTFTSVAGEDGSAIEWDALGCWNDLPTFVNEFGYHNYKTTLRGTVRMETPVIYFYSSRELDAHVRVAFPQGLITEWYPRAERLTSAIEWRNIKVQPETTPALPVESGPNRYYAARATDAAPVAVGDQHEKFLFYRGVGRFPVPLSARVSGDGKIVAANRGSDAIPTVILFENRGGRMGYRNAGALADTVTFDRVTLDRVSLDRPLPGGGFPQLRYDLETALVAQGLYPKEAQAMVETWRDSWFEEGSRLIYLVPSRAIDAILPLEVEPVPSRTTRVFVGRIELITAETKRLVEQAIAKRDRLTIDLYSRFLDPILKRIASENPTRENQTGQFRGSTQESISAANCR